MPAPPAAEKGAKLLDVIAMRVADALRAPALWNAPIYEAAITPETDMGHAAAIRPSTAFPTVDFDKPGKQIGFVMFPHSPHGDAWGVTRVPIAVIANGRGPTVILEGGNHGDEYEGPIAIGELIRDLDPGEIQGPPHPHASQSTPPPSVAAQRTSPVDGLNFNRTFPGDPRGTITQQIAAYVTDHIFPHRRCVPRPALGRHVASIILPSAIIEPARDPPHRQRNIAAVQAFDAPLTVVIDNLGETRTATATAIRAGLITVGTEMAGGGTVSLEALQHLPARGAQRARPSGRPDAGEGAAGARPRSSCSCPAPRPMSSRQKTASSSRSTRMAAKSARANRRGAFTS